MTEVKEKVTDLRGKKLFLNYSSATRLFEESKEKKQTRGRDMGDLVSENKD